MKKTTAKKLEIFLLLALRQAAADKLPSREEPASAEEDAPDAAATEDASPSAHESEDAEKINEFFLAFSEQLTAPENEKLERLYSNYQDKSEAEKQNWRLQTARSIGGDELPLVDESVHRSHVEAALNREIPAIRRIVAGALPAAYKNLYAPVQNKAENDLNANFAGASARLEKTVRATFARQFVAVRDLPAANVFDGLSGAQIARLARLAGIREVARACAGINAVEAVGAFLRRFEPEDGRAVAAQLSGLPKISAERLAFAENLVQNALEIEAQKPSAAMLDWIGIRLIGILLCAPQNENAARVAYTEQKLPLETAPRLSEIIEIECRKTPPELRKKIGSEVERLAETIAKSGA